jgi:hypothetical protein
LFAHEAGDTFLGYTEGGGEGEIKSLLGNLSGYWYFDCSSEYAMIKLYVTFKNHVSLSQHPCYSHPAYYSCSYFQSIATTNDQSPKSEATFLSATYNRATSGNRLRGKRKSVSTEIYPATDYYWISFP